MKAISENLPKTLMKSKIGSDKLNPMSLTQSIEMIEWQRLGMGMSHTWDSLKPPINGNRASTF